MRWTEERKDELRGLWALDPSPPRIARRMGETIGAIKGKAIRLNLHFPRSGRARSLAPSHPAVLGARTLFPNRVTDDYRNGILKYGSYQRKLGGRVTKGKWKGMPIYAITLEERATCPRDCAVFNLCYGNGMSLATRYVHGPAFERKLWDELGGMQRKHRRGFVVRAHILGDWYSAGYVEMWREALAAFPALRVFGYTAYGYHTKIGRSVAALRDEQWDRFAIRTSGASSGPRTLVIDEESDCPADAIVCPAQTERTLSCGTCSLCWATQKTVAFLRH